jgi:ABC-type methionine transport system ATPase subunit
MQQIANWTPEERITKMAQAQAVADYNKKLFFSEEWQESIFDEYKRNFSKAMEIMIANITAANTRKIHKLQPDSEVSDERKENRRKVLEITNKVREKFIK